MKNSKSEKKFVVSVGGLFTHTTTAKSHADALVKGVDAFLSDGGDVLAVHHQRAVVVSGLEKQGFVVNYDLVGYVGGRVYDIGCYGIVVETMIDIGRIQGDDHICGTITSDLKKDTDKKKDAEYRAAIDGLESLILAHACAGIDITTPAYLEGIESAVDAISNNFGD